MPILRWGDKEILNTLQKLKTNKAAGPNGIFPRVLKEISKIIFKPVASIFRWSLETRKIPNDWKQGVGTTGSSHVSTKY